MKNLLISTLLLSGSAYGQNESCDAYTPPFIFNISQKDTFGNGIGFSHPYSTIGLFATTTNTGIFTPILDARWHYFCQDNSALSSAVGFRFSDQKRCYFGGFFLFYDYRIIDNQFINELGGEAELLTPYFDLRLHAYFPTTEMKHLNTQLYDDYVGDFFLERTKYAFPFKQVFLDISTSFFRTCAWDLYGTLGGYYLVNHRYGEGAGIRSRLQLYLFDYVQGFVEASYDKIFKGRFAYGISFSLTFGYDACCNNLSFQPSCKPYDSVHRQEIIPVRSKCCWEWNFDDTIR